MEFENNSSSSDEDTPPHLRDKALNAAQNLLPKTSDKRYNLTFENFNKWREANKADKISENVMLAYFNELSEKLKPSTIWSKYSMLKSTININCNIDIGTYKKLTAFVKRQSDGFKSKKSKVLSAENIDSFLKEAPDVTYLATKVRAAYK